MNEYLLRYPKDKRKQDAYENACDCLNAGLTWEEWRACGLCRWDMLRVWARACKDIGMY